ncbi:hypothetical protein ACIBIZ_24285 [Nonomuraea spiralis]|uniref:hypothetical protein n=1 Tax=Nonomuraea spiralis TaxID=46182 RepID=UPI0037B3A72F
MFVAQSFDVTPGGGYFVLRRHHHPISLRFVEGRAGVDGILTGGSLEEKWELRYRVNRAREGGELWE